MLPFIAHSPNSVLDQASQFVGRTVNGLLRCRRFVGDRDRLMVLKACLHGGSDLIGASLVPVLVGQVNLHSRDVWAEMAQHPLHDFANMIGEGLAAFDMMVNIYLDLHDRVCAD